MADVYLTGDKQLIRRIHALAGPIQRKIFRTAARAALRPTLAAARRNAPRRTGALAKSIKLRATKRNRAGKIGARVTTGTATNDFAGKTFYAAFLEYGWKAGKRLRRRQLKTGTGDKRRQIPAVGFMKRAADETKNQAQAIFRQTAGNLIVGEINAVK